MSNLFRTRYYAYEGPFYVSNALWWVRLTVTAPTGSQLREYYPMRVFQCSDPSWRLSSSDSSEGLTQGPIQELSLVTVNDKWDVYPNPAVSDKITVQVELSKESKVDIRLTDIIGRELRSQAYEHLSTGINRLSMDVSNLASGFYQLVLIKHGIKEVKSITIHH